MATQDESSLHFTAISALYTCIVSTVTNTKHHFTVVEPKLILENCISSEFMFF